MGRWRATELWSSCPVTDNYPQCQRQGDTNAFEQSCTSDICDKTAKINAEPGASSRMEGKFHFEGSEDEVPDILGEPTQVYTYSILLNIWYSSLYPVKIL